ncbi:hypothetical protein TOTORO_03290 [Serratia phage vB_SmaS-Totoro]|nr:hypothetical protein TOTORO_03290 [Serratia phage vB_SmaS-Totoro]
MVKVEITANGQHRLTSIFDVEALRSLMDAITSNREVFSKEEFMTLSDPYVESIALRIRDGYTGVVGLSTALNLYICITKPTDIELERVSVSLRPRWSFSTRLIRAICYRGEIYDMFSLFKVNSLRSLSLTARAHLSSLNCEEWTKLRSGDNELALMGGDYTLVVTPIGQPSDKITQIFTPVEVSAVSDSPQEIKKETISLSPELIEAAIKLKGITPPEKAVTPIIAWVNDTMQYFSIPRGLGKTTANGLFKRLTARLEKLQCACKRGDDMSKVIVYRGAATANGKKTNFVLTYDMVYGKQEGFSWVINRVARQIKRNLGEDISPPILYHAFHITNLGRWVELVPGLEVRIEAVL